MAMKFVADMSPAEQEIATFGVGFKRDANGKPIEQGLGSDAHIRTGKDRGSIHQHLTRLEISHGKEAADQERDRINAICRAAGVATF